MGRTALGFDGTGSVWARAWAVAAFLACTVVFLAAPLLLSEGYAHWRNVPYEIAETHTVEVLEMPTAYRGRPEFTSRGTGLWHWEMQCHRLARLPDAVHDTYRCKASRIKPRDGHFDPYVVFPAASGWRLGKRTYEIDHLAQVSNAAQLWAFALATLFGVWLLRRMPVSPPERSIAPLIAAGWCVLILAVGQVAAMIVTPWATDMDWQVMEMGGGEFRHAPLQTILSLVILGPALEEIVFRGIGWRSLRAAFPQWATAAITTVVFVAVHPGNSPAVLLLIGLNGLGLALLRIKTGSVAWCIALHGAMNGITLLVTYLQG